MKSLAARIEMVEVQRRNTAVVAAQCATSAGLGHQYPLHLAPAATHPLQAATLATVITTTLEPKRRHAMLATPSHNGRLAGSLRRMRGFLPDASSLRIGLESILPQPVSDGPLAAFHVPGDLSNRHARLHQGLQLTPCKSSSSYVLVSVCSPKPMFLNPVAHSRFVQAKPSPDLSQRQALPQQLLERSAIHASHCPASIGRKSP
jgi:hypothetical protein